MSIRLLTWVSAALLLALWLTACSAQPEKIPVPTGHYEGTLTARGAELRITFDLHELPGDSLLADLRMPAAQNLGWHYARVRFAGSQLEAGSGATPALNIRHESNFFRGTVRLHDTLQAQLLVLRRGAAAAPVYRKRQVRLATAAGLRSVTLFVPADTLPHPAVVLLPGNSTMQQQTLQAHADLLARNGFVALLFGRPDASQSNIKKEVQAELVDAALAAVRALKFNRRVDSTRVGLWGVADGATAAALAASQPGKPVAFVVGVSSAGVTEGAALRYQSQVGLRKAGASTAEARQAMRAFDALEQFLRRGRTTDSLKAATALTAAWQQPWAVHTALPRELPTAAEREAQAQWRNFALDPRQTWQQVRVPVLLLYGGADDRFNASEAAQRLRRVVRQRGSAVKLYPGADQHLLVNTAPADSTTQWQWPQPAPGYLEDMPSWLKQQTEK
ncbi:hypothetical protein [Hymenobacter koreensis]|uniref:Alpha/beta hydrolase n=1 Tax=Hymenobacter koreensis TaxID=1084523 RepID=A0ABP8IWS1_9BACT